MRRIFFIMTAFLFAFYAIANAKQAEIPYNLSWEMEEEEISENMFNAGFSVWDVSSFDDTGRTMLETYGFTKMYFKNDDISPRIGAYITLYKGKLYSLVLRYREASPSERAKILRNLQNQFASPELDFSDNGVHVYGWRTEKSVIVFSLSEGHENSFSSITRLAYTDLLTKQRLGPGAP